MQGTHIVSEGTSTEARVLVQPCWLTAGENLLKNTGLGYTVIRAGPLLEEPGGYRALIFDQVPALSALEFLNHKTKCRNMTGKLYCFKAAWAPPTICVQRNWYCYLGCPRHDYLQCAEPLCCCCRVIALLKASAVQMLQMCVSSLCMIQRPATKRLKCAMSTHQRRVSKCMS